MAAPAATFLAALRMRALAYRYDYDSRVHERIVANVHGALGDKLEHPNEDIRLAARSAAHYRAQLALRGRASIWLLELAAIPALPVVLLWSWVKGLFRLSHARSCDGVRLVFAGRFTLNPEIFLVPGELQDRAIETRPLMAGFLRARDVGFIVTLLLRTIRLGTPFPLQFAVKCALDLAMVRGCLSGLAPSFVLVYWEFNCAITPVAWALKREGIATYNVMHGDKNFFAKNAFFEVARCYCWNAFYVDLFKREHVQADFRLFINPAFRLTDEETEYTRRNPAAGVGVVAPNLVTLADTPEAVAHAVDALAAACNAIGGHHLVTMRPHPFYAKEFEAYRSKLTPAVAIITATDEAPRAFILRHNVLVGTTSTMLVEAANLGRRVVVLRTPVMADMERYHYIYKLPNVTICTIADLVATVERVLSTDAPAVPAARET